MEKITLENYKQRIKSEALENPDFIMLILTNKKKKENIPFEKISLRSIHNEESKLYQIDYYFYTKHEKKLSKLNEIDHVLDDVLQYTFDYIHLQSLQYDIHVRFSKRGRLFAKKSKPSRIEVPRFSKANRVKRYPFPEGQYNQFLEYIGIMNTEGKVFPSKYKKFKQINQFLKSILELDMLGKSSTTDNSLLFVDCGCGKANLTFSVYHYVNVVLKKPAFFIGIDRNPEVIERCKETQRTLDYERMEFHLSSIHECSLPSKPDLVFSLHACDTATDEAIAKAIRWDASAIIAAPCCQHELHEKMKKPELNYIIRHGILRERMADILTDAIRALVLRIMGYKAEVIEFISPEHTSKNLLIRAEKKVKVGEKTYIDQYLALKKYWNISPVIEELIGEPFMNLLST